jgi:asparagine N-glycosylation enzyme membrane subunit Stt3
MNKALPYWIIWLVFALVTAAVAMLYSSASFVDGQYIPVGNDSFYHARRIIDAAVGERGFYEFDTMIHVPEGSWLNWPWGYDFLMSVALRVAMWLRPNLQPMAFLAHVPVFFVLVNVGLLTLVAREAKLGQATTAIALLIFALLPITQSIHGLGRIDHHFLELSFVLLTVYFGLRFFDRTTTVNAVALGIVLGFASAFHNGLFILQIPVLICILLLWSRITDPDARGLISLALTTFLATLLVAIPSAPFRDLQFEFWTLSWFQPYVALCSGIIIAYSVYRPCTRNNFLVLIGIGLVMSIPMFTRIIIGTAFLSGQLDVIVNIVEVRSPLVSATSPGGIKWVTSQYSWLIFLAPVILTWHLARLFQLRDQLSTYLSVWIVFGLIMMLFQFRLHPFGSWALIIGGLLAIEPLRTNRRISSLAMFAVTLAFVAIALQPPIRNQLFKRAPPGLSRSYAAARTLYPGLEEACAARPGVVLSYGDDGHPIRYHTDCSVIINNFLITPFHQQKILEVDRYFQMSPQQFLQEAPHVRYIFVRMSGIFRSGPSGIEAAPLQVIKANNAPLFNELTFSQTLPDEF